MLDNGRKSTFSYFAIFSSIFFFFFGTTTKLKRFRADFFHSLFFFCCCCWNKCFLKIVCVVLKIKMKFEVKQNMTWRREAEKKREQGLPNTTTQSCFRDNNSRNNRSSFVSRTPPRFPPSLTLSILENKEKEKYALGRWQVKDDAVYAFWWSAFGQTRRKCEKRARTHKSILNISKLNENIRGNPRLLLYQCRNKTQTSQRKTRSILLFASVGRFEKGS